MDSLLMEVSGLAEALEMLEKLKSTGRSFWHFADIPHAIKEGKAFNWTNVPAQEAQLREVLSHILPSDEMKRVSDAEIQEELLVRFGFIKTKECINIIETKITGEESSYKTFKALVLAIRKLDRPNETKQRKK